MIAQKEVTPELDGLTSNSSTAIWRLLFYICAVAIKVVEDLFEVHDAQIEIRAKEILAGTTQWYAAETLLYQHGDDLSFNRLTGQFGYEIDDPDKQIVELSACIDDATGAVYVKAAKINSGTGLPEKLSGDELTGLGGYWIQKKFAGTNLTIVSVAGDKLWIGYRVIYDATILNSAGELLEENTIKPVEDAINDYLITFGRENFAGLLLLQDITDAIQAARGVINAVSDQASAKQWDDTGNVDFLADPDQLYISYAGYLVIDPAHPLDVTITYLAQT